MMQYVKLFEQWDKANKNTDVAKVAIVGDIMQHERQLKFEKQRGFSYDGVFDDLTPVFNGCDLVVGNLETTIGDSISGFPYFSAPQELLHALKQTGFDVLITSNNHTLDHGEEGLRRTYSSIVDEGMIPIGTMGMSSRTFDLNGNIITLHAYTGFVNEERSSRLLSFWDGRIQKGEGINIAYIHSGKEFSRAITPKQIDIIDVLKRKGFDGVFFSHSHIPGPLHQDEDFFVVFGMGNFISDQSTIKGPEHGNCIILELASGRIQNIEVLKTSSIVQDDGNTHVSLHA